MFEDILENKPKPNKKIVCPDCGTTVITVETEFGSEEYEIELWDYNCKKCAEKR